MIYMFLSNNPLSGDINSSNLPCLDYKACLISLIKQKPHIKTVPLNLFHCSLYEFEDTLSTQVHAVVQFIIPDNV